MDLINKTSPLIRKIAVDFHFIGFQPQFSCFLRLKKFYIRF